MEHHSQRGGAARCLCRRTVRQAVCQGVYCSASAAEAVDRRERTPHRRLPLDYPTEAPIENVLYRLRNEGPEDLDRVTVFRPKPLDGITYPIVVTGAGAGYAEDEIDLGPLALTRNVRFTLCCGAAEEPPEPLVRVECAAGDDEWTLSLASPSPRPALDPRVQIPVRRGQRREASRAVFQDRVSRGGDYDPLFEDQENKFIGQGLRDSAGLTGNKPLERATRRWRAPGIRFSRQLPPIPAPE